MLVRVQNNGHMITGLRIGTSNVRRHFRSHLNAIELELDHLRIRCELNAGFWHGQSEISDPRLCAWLEEKYFWHALPSTISAEMVPTGDSYRLHLRCSRQQKTN